MLNILDKLDKKSLSIISQSGILASALGYQAYLVGGPVRDLAIGCKTIDLDITVVGDGIRLAEKFTAEQSGAMLTRYPAFKTATVNLQDGRVIDFATARKETYSRGGAFPKVSASGIKDDLFRRDFTINAIAISINPESWGKIIDPFGGMKDLKAKRVRILHEKSFYDDPTRILRAGRFKERLDFKLELKTLKNLEKAIASHVLDTIKPQRYGKEYSKILKEKRSKAMVKCLKSWNAYKES